MDTGASVSAINSSFFRRIFGQLKFKPLQLPKGLIVRDAGGRNILIKGYYKVLLKFDGTEYLHDFYIVDNLACPIILGMDFINANGLIIDGARKEIRQDKRSVTEPDQLHTVYCSKLTKVPPKSILSISVDIPDQFDKELAITPIIGGINCLIKTDPTGQSKILVNNQTDEILEIGRGEEIALFHKIHTIDPISKPHLTKPLTSGSVNISQFLAKFNLTAPTEVLPRYKELIWKYREIFSTSEYDLGWTDLVSHEIKVKSNMPIYTKQFRIPMSHQQIINRFVDDMLDKHLIEAARTRYNSPIFCVKKKNGTWRPVIDLRKINDHTLKDAYSIKDVRTCLDSIGNKESDVFSTIDLKSGFLQQNLETESRPFTGFTIPGRGQYQFKVSCFGSTGAPSSFSKLMDTVLRGLKNVVSYIDDILVYSKGHSEHLRDLENCFLRLKEHNLKISIEKSIFGSASTEYLGFKIDRNGIKPGTDKLKSVRDFPPPKTIRQIRQFVGLASFFREHIPNFSKISGYLTALTRKNSGWSGGQLPHNALIAFRTLQKNLISAPAISYPRPDIPYLIFTDAAAGTTGDDGNPKFPGGLGAVLMQQWPEDNKYRVIAYASRSLRDHERNYSAFMLELLAVHFGIKKFHHYIYGGKTFTVFTDHKPLEALNRTQTKTVNRLTEELMEYDFKYQYKKNSEMKVADFLSRNPIGTDSYETDDPNNLYILSSYSWNEALCAASNNFLDQLGDKSPLNIINENPKDFAKLQ